MNFLEAVKAMKKGKKVKTECFVVWLDGVGFMNDKIRNGKLENNPQEYMTLPYVEATDWKIYKEEDLTAENMEKIKKALKFVEHLENHPEVKNTPVNAGVPMCKICDRTIDEIYENKKT